MGKIIFSTHIFSNNYCGFYITKDGGFISEIQADNAYYSLHILSYGLPDESIVKLSSSLKNIKEEFYSDIKIIFIRQSEHENYFLPQISFELLNMIIESIFININDNLKLTN